MTDSALAQLLTSLADATRDLPSSKVTDVVRDRLISVIQHLEHQGLIPQANWNLGPR